MEKDNLMHKIANGINTMLGEGACKHKKVTDIGYCEGFDGRLYDAYCTDCEKQVYGRTGKKYIRWNYDRNGTFA